MKSVYIVLLEDEPYVPLLYPNLGAQARESILFLNKAFRHLSDPLVTIADTVDEADCVLLPHNYPSLKGKDAYVSKLAELAHSHSKPFVAFWHGDSDSAFPIEDAVVFRTSQYRGNKRSNEVIMPAYADDLLEGDIAVREKHDGKPIVGFCGWADYKNIKNRIGTLLKNSLIEAGHLFGMRDDARIKGITYRMKTIRHLQSSDLIQPNFIVRSSYSGHSATIKTDPKQTRKEYVENLLSSDYALVIKGDGNYSYRFYEALSLGRIPVLLDTDCILPLEDEIDYDSFILRVPYYDLYRLDHVVSEHYASVSNEEFIAMQMNARKVFEQFLRVDAFLAYAVGQYF